MTNTLSEAQKFIYMSRYSRWIPELGRREQSWEETTNRYFSFFEKRFGDIVPKKYWVLMKDKVNSMGVMPSMRCVWAAGDALEKNNIIAYNCSYIPFQDLRAPVEMFYILMCGTGTGFSIEDKYIKNIPSVPYQTAQGYGTHIVNDSREGWAHSLDLLFKSLWEGKDISFDYSRIRPKGARLKTMGGRASGSQPLIDLHKFVRNIVLSRQGEQLSSLDWLDISNKIADVVVVGGVRRSSQISFSDLGDDLIRHAKDGNFPPHRFNSNNSAVYYEKPDVITFMKEWSALAASGRGERGIYNLSAIKSILPGRRVYSDELRCNPCGEIYLHPFEFCNLSEVVVRAEDTFDDLINKVKAAVWIGAMQSTLTDFPFIRDEWKENCEEERLLGVSLTGQMDNVSLLSDQALDILKKYAMKECSKACKALGINMSAAITCGKPSGTISQLVDSSSGCHPRFAKYYVRRYRISGTDPLFKMMRDQGIKFLPEVGQESLLEEDVTTWVCDFPMKSPEGAVTRDEVSAIDQLEWYRKIRNNWCEHNQSITVYVKDNEWLSVGAWVYDHFDEVAGVSFLPYDGGKYKLAPFEEISEKEYHNMREKMPIIDYTQLSRYELDDETTGAKEYACVGGVCELV